MGSSILLSLSPLIGLLILCVFRGISVLIARIDKNVINEYIVPEESALDKNVNKCSEPTRIFIPNVVARWPWRRRINPNYAVVREEADAWITSFQAFSPKAQDAFNRCDFSKFFLLYSARIPICFLIDLLACLAHPTARKGKVTADTLIELFAQSFFRAC